MNYDELLKAGRIRQEKISNDEIRHALERAKRDLKAAREVMASDWDWGFAIAYNAVLQASRAYMFAQEYRASWARYQGLQDDALRCRI